MYLLVTFAAEIGSSDTRSIAPLLAFVHISSIAELVVQQTVTSAALFCKARHESHFSFDSGLAFFLLSFVS